MVDYTYMELMALVDHVQQLFTICCKRADDLRAKDDSGSMLKLAEQIGYMNACNDLMTAVNAQVDVLSAKGRVLQ